MTTTRHRRLSPIVPLLALLSAGIASAGAVPLMSCGQTLETDVYLTADLDCSASPTHGVDFVRPARLELRGFSIRNAQLYGVQCHKRCTITGPGGIVDGAGIAVRNGAAVRIRNVTISGNGASAVDTENNLGNGRARIFDSRIENNGAGIFVQKDLLLSNTTVTGNGGFGVFLEGMQPYDAPECHAAGRVRMIGSTVEVNGMEPECTGNADCADIRSCGPPVLDDASSCGTSRDVNTGEPWGVCALD